MGQVASNIVWATETGRAATLQEPADVETLLSGCPRELAETLRETGQWDALRCRPWLSASAFRGLQRSLQRCQLPKLTERYREALSSDDCTYSLPPVVPWEVVEVDHFISAGQVFRREDASHDKICRLRRIGLQVLRRGKVGMVLWQAAQIYASALESHLWAARRKFCSYAAARASSSSSASGFAVWQPCAKDQSLWMILQTHRSRRCHGSPSQFS